MRRLLGCALVPLLLAVPVFADDSDWFLPRWFERFMPRKADGRSTRGSVTPTAVAAPAPPAYLEFAPTSGSGLPVLDSFCSVVSGYVDTEFCVNGDGLAGAESDVGVTLIGDAASESLTRCPNGLDCTGASHVRFTTTGAIKASTSTTYSSTTAMTACWWGKTGDGEGAIGAQYNMLMSQLTVNSYPTDGWYLLFDRNLFSLQAIFGAGGTSTVTGTVFPGVEYLICMVHDGNPASSPTVWVNGANLTNAPNVTGTLSATAPISVGAQNGIENYGDTMLTLGAFKAKADMATSMAALYAAVANAAPKALISGTPSLALTHTRTGVMYCSKADNTGTTIPANRPCVAQNELLIEAIATNYILRGQEFNNAAWSKSGSVSITANYGIAPDGTKTAERYVASALNDYIYASSVGTAGSNTISVFVKGTSGSGTLPICQYVASASNYQCDDCSYSSSAWTRCSNTRTTTTDTRWLIGNILGASSDDVLIWGAQGEIGAVATSYIPTTSASAARGASFAYFTHGQTAYATGCIGASRTSTVAMNQYTNSGFVSLESDLVGAFQQSIVAFSGLKGYVGQVSKVTGTLPAVAGTDRVILRWDGSGTTLSTNGTVTTGTAGTPAATTYLRIGNYGGGALDSNGMWSGRYSSVQFDPSPSRCQ